MSENLGYTGPTGPTGPVGENGDNLKGDMGEPGLVGDPGFMGIPGREGEKGPAGTDYVGEGLIGYTGPSGQRGEPGIPGIDGPDGTRGPQGDAGPQGVTGFVGPVGPQGAQGEKGEKGEPGPVGPTGERGPIGIAGNQGDQGEKGEVGIVGVDGGEGDGGDKGDIGPEGAKGEPGVVGPKGLMGPPGDQGAIGETGMTGMTGLKGTVGKVGLPGVRGEVGNEGAKGDRGDTGIVGFTPAFFGSIGPTGQKGDQGHEGPKGQKGEKGVVGDVGPTGIDNVDGDKGSQGPQGFTGPEGLQGPTGPTGIEGGYIDWDQGVDTGVVRTVSGNGVAQVIAINSSNANTTYSLDVTGNLNVSNGVIVNNGFNYLNATDDVVTNSISAISTENFYTKIATPGQYDRKNILVNNKDYGVKITPTTYLGDSGPSTDTDTNRLYLTTTASFTKFLKKPCGIQPYSLRGYNYTTLDALVNQNPPSTGTGYKGVLTRIQYNNTIKYQALQPFYYLALTDDGIYYQKRIKFGVYNTGMHTSQNFATSSNVVDPRSVAGNLDEISPTYAPKLTGKNNWVKLTSVPGSDPTYNFVGTDICWVPTNKLYWNFEYATGTTDTRYAPFFSDPNFSWLTLISDTTGIDLSGNELSNFTYDASGNITNAASTNIYSNYDFNPDIDYYVAGKYKLGTDYNYLSKYNPKRNEWTPVYATNGDIINGEITHLSYSHNFNQLFIAGSSITNTGAGGIVNNSFLIYNVATNTYFSPPSLTGQPIRYKYLYRCFENIIEGYGRRPVSDVYIRTFFPAIKTLPGGVKQLLGPNIVFCCGDGDSNGNYKIACYDSMLPNRCFLPAFKCMGGPIDGQIMSYIPFAGDGTSDNTQNYFSNDRLISKLGDYHIVGGNFSFFENRDTSGNIIGKPIKSSSICYYRFETNTWYGMNGGLQYVDASGNDTLQGYVDDIKVIPDYTNSIGILRYYVFVKGNFNRIVSHPDIIVNGLAIYELLSGKWLKCLPTTTNTPHKFFDIDPVIYPSNPGFQGHDYIYVHNNIGNMTIGGSALKINLITNRSNSNNSLFYQSSNDNNSYYIDSSNNVIASGAYNTTSFLTHTGISWEKSIFF